MGTLDESDYARIHEIVHGAVRPLNRDLLRHERALFGNGQPGLIKDVEGLKGSRTKERISLASLAGVIATIVAGVIAGITHTPPTQ